MVSIFFGELADMHRVCLNFIYRWLWVNGRFRQTIVLRGS